MKKHSLLPVYLAAALFAAPALASAAPSANQICKKMIAEGRANGMSQSECLCTYRVADAVLDDDIKALLFDSWYHGTNNMQTMSLLPNPRRVEKQLFTMSRSLKTNCGPSFK